MRPHKSACKCLSARVPREESNGWLEARAGSGHSPHPVGPQTGLSAEPEDMVATVRVLSSTPCRERLGWPSLPAKGRPLSG